MNNFGNDNRKQLGSQFEEQFKNKFKNAQFSPPAHLWEQIDAALEAKPWYRRPLFYWTSGLVASLLLVVMFWFTLVYDNSAVPSTTDIVNVDATNKINKNEVENTVNENVDSETNYSSSQGGIRTIQTPNDAGFNNIEVNPVQENELVVRDITTLVNKDKNKNKTNQEKTNNVDADKAISVVLNNGEDKSREKEKNVETVATSNTAITETTIILEPLTFKEMDWANYLPIGNPYFEKEVFVKLDTTNETSTDNKNGQALIEDSKKSSGIAIAFGINYTQGIYRPTFRRDSIYTGLTVIGANSYNLADTLPQINISGNYQQSGFDVALQFGKNGRWSLNTGLGRGKANYSFGSTNYTLVGGGIQGQNQVPHYDNQVTVKYEWLQVPIAIGYQFGESRAKRFSGFAQLGTAIEFLSSYSYTSADPTFTYALGSHRTTNTQVWTQAGINYHITNRWTLWGGGTYKSSLSSLINEDGVTFSSQAYGWQVGTRFTVFRTRK